MPAVRPPTLWLAVAATTISAIAVATMVMSGGPRRPLSFAGAILAPDSRSGTAAQPGPLVSRSSRRPAPSAGVRPPATTPAMPTSSPTPVTALVPVRARSTGSPPPRATAADPVPAGAAAPTPSGRGSPPATGEPATPVSSGSTAIAQALFTALNTARIQAGLAPLAWSAGLQRSAAVHNGAMAAGNQLAARVGSEPGLGVRQANQGVLGNYAAEASGVTQRLSRAGALAVQQAMLSEQAPEGHRQDLMSGTLSSVGIDVLLDPASGRLWLTEDFAELPSAATGSNRN